ncbi:MAG: sulfotransferase, partial [Kordiimonas sp.]
IYKNYFSSKGSGYAYDMEDLARYYTMYEDLMAFWFERFPDKIYDLHYEQLTECQEQETRKMLAYCDLGWEDKCLEFHKTTRSVVTASTAQVRQKMYQGSSEKWRAYERHLVPLLDALHT